MRAEGVVERLSAIASGEFVAVPGRTPGTLGTARGALAARICGNNPGPVPSHVPDRKSPLFTGVFQFLVLSV